MPAWLTARMRPWTAVPMPVEVGAGATATDSSKQLWVCDGRCSLELLL
jgi:hypothetical protein